MKKENLFYKFLPQPLFCTWAFLNWKFCAAVFGKFHHEQKWTKNVKCFAQLVWILSISITFLVMTCLNNAPNPYDVRRLVLIEFVYTFKYTRIIIS